MAPDPVVHRQFAVSHAGGQEGRARGESVGEAVGLGAEYGGVQGIWLWVENWKICLLPIRNRIRRCGY